MSTLFFRSVDQCCVGESFPPTASPFFLLLSLFLGMLANVSQYHIEGEQNMIRLDIPLWTGGLF